MVPSKLSVSVNPLEPAARPEPAAGLPLLSIVIPAYNEQENIPEILTRLLQVSTRLIDDGSVADVEILVVNDCSTDGTAAEVARFGHRARLISHPENRGYGAALKTGFAAASGEWIAFLDADLTYPPESFPRLCEAMHRTGADILVGSRMMGRRTGMPVQRYVGNKLFAYLLSWIMDKRITDTASGMRIFKRTVLPRLMPLPDGLHLTPAMSTCALLEDLNVVETGIPYHERGGRSKLSAVKDGIRFLKIILGTARLYRPLKFYGLAGALLLVLGIALGIPPALHYLRAHIVEEYAIYRLFTVMVSLVLGLNLLTFGAFSERVLQITCGRPRYGGLLERLIFRKSTVDRFGRIGLCCILSGILLNTRTILEYVTTLHITIHWSYVLTGATLLLCGFQMVMASFLLEILKTIASQKADSRNGASSLEKG